MNTVIIINHLNIEFDEVPMNIDDGKEGNDDEKGVEEDGILELGIETGNEVGEDVGEEVGEEVVDEQEEGQDGSDLEATALSTQK